MRLHGLLQNTILGGVILGGAALSALR